MLCSKLRRRTVRVNGADCGVAAIVLGVITSMGGFLFGYDTGQILAILRFKDFKDRFAQELPGDDEWEPIIKSLIVSLMSIVCLLGALSGAW